MKSVLNHVTLLLSGAAICMMPQMALATEKVCQSGALPKAYQGTYIESTTTSGTNVELTASAYRFTDLRGELQITSCLIQGFRILTVTDKSNPDSIENAVLLKSESGNLVLIPLSQTPTGNWPTRVSDLIRTATPAMVLEKRP